MVRECVLLEKDLWSCQAVKVINVAAVQNDINHFCFFSAATAYYN